MLACLSLHASAQAQLPAGYIQKETPLRHSQLSKRAKNRSQNRSKKELLATSLVLVGCAFGCALIPPVFNFVQSVVPAFADASLDSSLKTWAQLPVAELVQKLEDFRNAPMQSEKQKERAAYVLARILQKSAESSASPSAGAGAGPSAGSAIGSNQADRAKQIIDYYDEASKIDELRPRCENHIVEVATAAQLEAELRTHLEQIRSHSKEAGAKSLADYALAQSYARTQEWDKAVPLLQKIQKEAPTTNQAIGANYYLARAEIAATAQTATQPGVEPGLSDAAVGYFRAYLTGAPSGRFAKEIADTLLKAANAQVAIPKSDRELFADVYYVAGSWSSALEQWSLAGDSAHLLQKTLCLARLGRSKEAQALFLQAVAKHETSSRTSYDAVATILTNPLTRPQTLEYYKQILAAHPTKADFAMWNVAMRTPLTDAQPMFQKILATYPTSEYAPESVWWLVWAQARVQHQQPAKLTAAIALARKGVAKYPASKAAAKMAFWAGKMNEQLHQPEQAKTDYEFAAKNFPSYYYGLRSATRLAALKANKKGPDKGWTTKPDRQLSADWSWPDYEQMTPDSTSKPSKLFTQLLSLQQLDEAAEVMPSSASQEYKAALRAAAGDFGGAIRAAGKNLEGRPTSAERWQMCYPRMFASDVNAGAQANNLDPLLIHALIREESRYNPTALSRVKAIGLTQLMPATAYGVAKRLNVPLSGLNDVYKPEINIKLGSNYLSSVLQRANNNALLAVASYNGGPNAVQTWLKEHNTNGYPDFDYFVENIPFRETRDYVRKVFGSYWAYENIYTSTN
jgi:soluble lytic murein transglycosylase